MKRKVRNTAILKAYARQRVPFTQTVITDKMREDFKLLRNCYAIWTNSRCEVQLFEVHTAIGAAMQMTIVRHGNIEPLSWEEIQSSVHEIFGPEATGIEVYPALVDEWQTRLGLRVIWILPTIWPLPFGLHMAGAWGKNEPI